MKKHIVISILALSAFTICSCSENNDVFNSSAPTAEEEIQTPDNPATNSLEELPPDLGGSHTKYPLGTTAAPYGYYLYTPSGYTSTGPKFPALIYLHGAEGIGDSQTDPAELDKLLLNGPPHLIDSGVWHPQHPMIVASVQCHEGWWDVPKVQQLTEYLMSHYQIDTLRIYMTGLSMGGFAVWDQLGKLGQQSHITAAVPISGGGVISDYRTHNAAKMPIWAFHGENDPNVDPAYDVQVNAAINASNPTVPAKLTMYPNTGHNAWTKTYDGSGMGSENPSYTPFNSDIYSWMLQYKK